MLSYIKGDVPSELSWYSDSELESAAKLIRRYHDATVELAQKHRSEVICHNDLSPCNFVFTGRLPSAIIDFNAAAPGSRSADSSYAAWLWLDIGNPDTAPQEQKRRLVLFCQAYGMSFDQHFVEMMLQRQTQLIAVGEKLSKFEMAEWATDCHAWTKENLIENI